jgi:hypothetical protein
MSDFAYSLSIRWYNNIASNFNSVPGGVSTAYSAYINLTNPFLGGSLVGKIIQFGRNVEASGVAFATGTDSANISGLVNAGAALAFSAALIVSAPLTLPWAIGSTIGSIVVGSLAQAIYDTINEFYPTLLSDFGRDLHDGLQHIADDLGDSFADLSENIADVLNDIGNSLHNLVSPLAQVVRDPLILDLDGNGVQLSTLANSTVHFDYDGNGFAERRGSQRQTESWQLTAMATAQSTAWPSCSVRRRKMASRCLKHSIAMATARLMRLTRSFRNSVFGAT